MYETGPTFSEIVLSLAIFIVSVIVLVKFFKLCRNVRLIADEFKIDINEFSQLVNHIDELVFIGDKAAAEVLLKKAIFRMQERKKRLGSNDGKLVILNKWIEQLNMKLEKMHQS